MAKDKENLKGGKADGLTAVDLARKHSLFIGTIEKEIEAGLKIEREHVKDADIAREIVMDHIFEFPDYYTNKEAGLKAMEEKLKKEMEEKANPSKKPSDKVIKDKVIALLKKHKTGKIPDKFIHALADELKISSHDLEPFFYELAAKQANTNESIKRLEAIIRENVGLNVVDETPSDITFKIMSDDVIAGEITIKIGQPDLGNDVVEILNFSMNPQYRTFKLAYDTIKGLWLMYRNINKIVLSPADDSITFCTRLGFNRLNNDYYFLLRGH